MAEMTPAGTPAQPVTPGVPGQTATTAAPAEAQQQEPIYEIDLDGKGPQKLTLKQVREIYGTAKSAAEIRRGAHQKFEEATKLSQTTKAYQEALKTGPAKTYFKQCEEAGIPFKEALSDFEAYYNENVIKPTTMTKAEREAREYQTQLEKERAEKEALLKEKNDRINGEEEARFRDGFQKDIIGALDTSGLPKTRFTVGRMAFWMKQNLARGYDAPMDVIVQQVKDERAELFSHEFGGRTIDEIIQMAGGEDFIKKVRKYDLERIKKKMGGDTGTEIHEGARHPGQPRGNQVKKSMRDVDAFFNDLRRSKR